MEIAGLKSRASEFSVIETVDRLIKKIEENGWHVFASIDHAKQARDKGLELRPTQVVLFGNPKIGTLLMQDRQTSAIDLPVKILVWEDEKGDVQVAYNAMNWIQKRHGLSDEATINNIGDVLENVCYYAAKK